MQAEFRAKIKSIGTKEGGTVVQLEPQGSYLGQIVELMPKVGLYMWVTVADEQLAFEMEAGYERPDDIEAEAEEVEYPALPEPEGDGDEDNE